MENARIRVGIVDDHEIVRTALRQLLDEQIDMTVVGEACDGSGALDLIRAKSPDVITLDLQMKGKGGMDVLRRLTARDRSARILVFSQLPEQQYATKVIEAGAYGYLSKDCEPSEILVAIRKLGSGVRYLSPDTRAILADRLGDDGGRRLPHEQLSDREFLLFIHLARGLTSAQAARALSLSPKTVSTYRTLLLDKLGMRTNSEITRYALQHGLID